MSALETWRTPLPDSEILSLRWAELLQPGLGRAGNLSVLMETRFSQPGEGLRKYGQCPVAPVSPAGMVHGPRHLADAGCWWWSDLPASSLGRWGLPPQPVVLAPPTPTPGEANCCLVQSRLHGNHPDSVNPHFLCFQQIGVYGTLWESQLR